MSAIFLSSSIPVVGRGNFSETADPFLIQTAVREFVTLVLGRRLIIWGGHPAITPMVWAVCEDLGVNFASSVVLYQSRFFSDIFPVENEHFGNVEYIDAVPGDRSASLLNMRRAMLSRQDLNAAVFIGGMEGVLEEHELFTELHPAAKVLPVPAPGGAARQLAERLGNRDENSLQNVDFSSLFHAELDVRPDEIRN
jgi:SLOG cluster3 family